MKKIVWISGIAWLILAIALTVLGKQLAAISGGAPKIDFMVSATSEAILTALQQYGDEGRRLYWSANLVDMLFAVALPVFAWSAARPFIGWRWLAAVAPAGFGILDIAENMLVGWLLAHWPGFDPSVGAACAGIVRLKLVFLVLVYLQLLFAAGVGLWRMVLRRGAGQAG